jgi:hypothetical protein
MCALQLRKTCEGPVCVFMCVHMCVSVFMCVHMCVCVFIYIDICIYKGPGICVFMYIWHIYMYIYICMRVATAEYV